MLTQILTTLVRSYVDRDDRGGSAPRADVIDHLKQELAESFLGEVAAAVLDDHLHRIAADGPVIAVGDRIVDLTVAAAGTPFTHRLTADEVASGVVALDADLPVVARIATADGGLHRRDGVPVTLRTTRVDHAGLGGDTLLTRTLHGPDGWLAGFEVDQVVTFTTAEGYVDVEPAGATDPVPDLAAELTAAAERANEGDGSPVLTEEPQAAGLLDGWHRPTPTSPPFGEILVAAGLELSGAAVGRPGGWDDHAEMSRKIGVYAQHGPHLEEKALRALEGFLGTFTAWRRDPSTTPEAKLLTDLFELPEAVFCLEEELAREDPTGADLARFIEAFAPPSTHYVAVPEGFRVLVGMLQGDATAVTDHLAATLDHDHSWPPALEHSATVAEARGDAQAAADLFQRTRDSKDDQLARLRQLARAGLATAGRNDPCPCGSGRKFKQCHQGKDLLPLADRSAWLIDRASTHLRQFRPDVVRDLETEAAATPAADAAETRALVDDLALFDRGGLQDYVSSWRSVMPDADRALADAWLAGSRPSVYVVVARTDTDVVLADRAPSARPADVAERATYRVVDVAPFADVLVDDLVWARLLPDPSAGDGANGTSGPAAAAGGTDGGASTDAAASARTWRTSGFVRPLLPDEQDVMLAATDADEVTRLRALLGGDHGLVDRAPDGHPRFWATTAWTVGTDRAAVEAKLDEQFGRFEQTWVFPPDAKAQPDVVATLIDPYESEFGLEEGATVADLAGTLGFDPAQVRLVSHTESQPAHEASKDRYRALFPDAELSDEQVTPIARRRALEQEDLLQEAFWTADERNLADEDDGDDEG